MAISPQLPEQQLSLVAKKNLEFMVLTDRGNRVARSFGLVFALPLKLRPIYRQFGIDLPTANGDESYELPLPATYVIDRQNTIRYDFVDIDYTKRLEPGEVIACLEKLID